VGIQAHHVQPRERAGGRTDRRVRRDEHGWEDRKVLGDIVGDRERRQRAAGDQQLLANFAYKPRRGPQIERAVWALAGRAGVYASPSFRTSWGVWDARLTAGSRLALRSAAGACVEPTPPLGEKPLAACGYERLIVRAVGVDDGGVRGARDPVRASSWLRSRCAGLIAAVALVVCSLAFADVGLGVAAAAGNPVGAHSMLQLNSPYSFMQAMFAEAAGMHASAIRLDVAPALVFADSSQPPDYSGLDEVIALSEQYHVRVIGDLFTIPWWIAACQIPTGNPARCGTDDLADYRSMIAQIVARADPFIRDWEIWNEPDNGGFFTGTPQQYAQMLRAAHDAIKEIDPQANVLLGGISGTSGMGWLAQVFAVPGADAAHAFDIANIHERGRLDALAADVASWKRFLGGYSFTGPLWVTEHGYPSDPAFQYDPAYAAGPVSQAAYLTASIPTLIDAGAGEVFVTERDNLGGEFASEGVLGGEVSDPPVADPQVVEKPAYAAVRAIAECYTSLGRGCPGPAPAASPASLTIPATRLGASSNSAVSVSDSGPGPLQLGSVALVGGNPGPIAVRSDSCSNQILEPDQTCTAALRFTPAAGGAVATTLQLPSDNGTLSVAVTAVAPSVSSLTSPQLVSPAFTPTGAADGVGHTQRLVLKLTNPLSAPVHVAKSTLSGPDAPRFLIQSNHCAGTKLAPGATCRLSVLFAPIHAGTARAVLTLRGDGTSLSIILHATAFALPSVTLLTSTDRSPCFARASGNRVLVLTDQPASVSWSVLRQHHAHDPRCRGGTDVAGPPSEAGRSSASGRTSTSARRILALGRRQYVARFAPPVQAGRDGLRPGAYQLTITATNAHGTSRSKTMWLTVLPPR
jgi:Abnormal spindle-like microcephaly-assoc'd, ASPM-SPD-2-Hydin